MSAKFVVAAVIMAFASAVGAQSYCSQLLVNPGAESGLSGWTTVQGAWTTVTPTQPSAHGGSKVFAAAAVPISVLVQTVPITAYAAAIAAGTQHFHLHGYLGSAVETTPDTIQLDFEILDANGVVGASLTSGPVGNAGNWTAVNAGLTAPVGGVTIRIRLTSTRLSGPTNDGFCDDLSLYAVPIEGTGQSNSPLALLDANLTAAITPGPFTLEVVPGTPINFTLSGPPNAAWYLAVGTVFPGAAVVPFGSLDLVAPSILSSGVLSPSGTAFFSVSTTGFPVGISAGVQALILNGGPSGGALTTALCIATI
jgi:hypothetical protein